MSNTKKVVGIVIAGSAIGFGGCLTTPSLGDVATYAAMEYIFDNDNVFDVFQDDFGTGTEYDDRFNTDPSREETE